MKAGIKNIIGKTVIDVIVAENESIPKQQVFFVFSDGTYFEFYGDNFNCTNGVNKGGLEEAMKYIRSENNINATVYSDSE